LDDHQTRSACLVMKLILARPGPPAPFA
jgi:hypothetical protein